MTDPKKKSDLKFISIVAAVAAIIAVVPYIAGQAMTPAGYLFQGNTILAPSDPNVYYSYIEQARRGAVLMRDVFTSEPHAATLWQPVWLVLGWIANIFHLSTPGVFALGRALSMVLFVMTVWWAVRWLWADTLIRRVATVLALGASGIGGVVGWLSGTLVGPMSDFSPDLWVSEMVPILSSWATPHFLLVTSGFLFVLVAVERSWRERSWRLVWWAGVVSLMTLSIHPFHILTWALLWAVLTGWRWKQTKTFPVGYVTRWAMVAFMSLPALTYYAVGLLTDPIVQGRAMQNINLTPSWWKVLVSLGLTGVLAAITIWNMRRGKNTQLGWIVALALIQLLVIFMPFNGQRRLMQGLIIPFALLATPVVVEIWRRVSASALHRTVLVISLAGLLGTSTIISGALIVNDYRLELAGRNNWEYFLTPEYQALFSFVKKNIASDRPILASAWDSVLIAGFTGRSVVGGHPVETLAYSVKFKSVKRFYNANQAEQQEIAQRYRACYILDGPRERSYGTTFNGAESPNLQIAWSGPTMTLYRVMDCSGE